MNNLDRLLIQAGGAVCSSDLDDGCPGIFRPLLERRNGFEAYKGALVVFGWPDMRVWNARNLWRFAYGKHADGLYCFAMDVFGAQFAVADEKIVRWDPDTNERVHVADDLDGWAAAIVADPAGMTGAGILHRYMKANGALPEGWRLVPVMHPGMTGTFDNGNLRAGPAAQLMRERASRCGWVTLPAGWTMKVEVQE